MLLPTAQQQILDWFHLMENLHKVGGSLKRLKQAQALLWQGKVEQAIELLCTLNRRQAQRFCQYLREQQHRLVHYEYYQAEGMPIGSGAVESLVKQIDRAEPKYQELSGRKNMSLKCWLTAVPISIDSWSLSFSRKSDTLPSTGILNTLPV
jgi:hypothetical protein